MASLEVFEFVRNIGKGSYGDVTLARHKRDRKQYVLKKINLKKASSRERKSAEQEAKLLSKLKHPNIVSYKDSFEKDGFLYIAMQFCEGGDLYNKLKEQRGQLLDERQLVEWFVQIAMALQYMHERNILHRDLKTQNIFLTKSKIIKVGDLGIARVLDSSTDMATTLIGTPYYMSPELFSNKPYNHKSDVWALGCCVYEMMTLKHAFNAKDMNSLVYKILRGKMPPMPKQYSTDLVSILRIMLHQDPAKRPTVNRILRDPYIKKNIAIFLEETKQSRRPASAAGRSRPGSAQSVTSISSAVSASSVASAPPVMRHAQDQMDSSPLSSDRSSDVPSARSSDSSRSVVSSSNVDIGAKGEQAKPVPAHRRKPPENKKQELRPIVEGQMVVHKHEEEEDSDNNGTIKANTVKENKEGGQLRGDNKKVKKEHEMPPSSSSPPRENHGKRKKRSLIGKHPKPVDKPRPLPPPPKMESDGLPQRRENYDNQPNSESKSSSSSGSKDDNNSLGDETPRSLPNMSAREKRRRNNNAQSYDRPHSARIRLEPQPASSKSTVVTHAERKRYDPQPAHQRHRQMSIADSSSSDEDTLKKSDEERINKQKQRLSHSLTNGGTAPTHRKHVPPHGADVTAHRKYTHQTRENKEMNNFIHLLDNTLQLNKEDDKSEEEELQEVKVPDETPRIPKSSSMPSVETLCNADRLMARIALLHEDCIKGVGWTILKEAYEILGRIEEDEVEPKLVALMGKDKFDLYAGKIWQLKFCEDMARIGIPS